MKKKLIVTLVLASLVLVIVLAMAVYAQGPQGDEGEEPGGVSGLGLSDPPPAGFTVLYMFTGAKDTQSLGANTAATSIHCTNYGSISTTVRVEISDKDNAPTASASLTLNTSQTGTFSSQNTAIYFEDAPPMNFSDDVNQGSGRILINNSTAKIICTAQVLDPVNNPPEYLINLDLFKP
jgi:hypothetical protein